MAGSAAVRPVISLSVMVLGWAMLSSTLLAQRAAPRTERIRALAIRGDSTAARALADSLARDSTASPAEQADGLYWRGMLATSLRTRRIEFSRVVVDFPLTNAAGDALYRLAQLDIAAGDRATARRQLQRALRDHGSSPTAGDAAFELGQQLIANGETQEGCAALDSAIQRTVADQVEKRNRMAYVRKPCANLVNETPADTASSPLWSAQIGAFASRADAGRIVTRLLARGYEARVTADRPFRVRIGRFTDRADATALIAKLKREKTAAILVEAERP